MGWQLFIVVVSACLLGHLSSGQERKMYENEKPINEPPEYCPSCECGMASSRRGRISGQETKVLEFPWMALLLNNGRFYCGGTLLNDYYVLTAAQCTKYHGFDKDTITVRLLEHDRSNPNETTTIDRKVSTVIRHPGYDPNTNDNDIALLKLDQRAGSDRGGRRGLLDPTILTTPFPFTRKGNMVVSTKYVCIKYLHCKEVDFSRRKRILAAGSVNDESSEIEDIGLSPVCLPNSELSYADYDGTVLGWGTSEEGGDVSDTLQKINVPIMSNENCRKTGYGEHRITDNMLCAGYPEGGKDACQGDSGGPLHIFNKDTYQFQEVGIVSFGMGCARPNYPGVYTRVNRYLPWIKSNTMDACYCSI